MGPKYVLLFWKAESRVRAVDPVSGPEMQSVILLSVRWGNSLLVWCLFDFVVLVTVLCFSFSVLLSFALFLTAFWRHLPFHPHHPPTQLSPAAFLCPFICLDFPILVSIQSVPYFSGGCSFWANRMLLSCYVFKALILLLSYKTKLDVAVGLLFTVYFSLCCTG